MRGVLDGNRAARHIKKADRLPKKVLKEKATDAHTSGLSFRELPFLDAFRNQLTAPLEDIVGTLATMKDAMAP